MIRGGLAIALVAALAGAAAAAASASAPAVSPSRGPLLFLQCRACHTVEAGGPNKVGPNLNGIFTRPALSAQGYRYSAAFQAARPRWNAASMDAWLARPRAVVPGTNMAFAGIPRAEDRAALMAWLRQAAAAPPQRR